MANDALRHPVFPYASPGDRFDREGFLAAVESREREKAEAMVLRGLVDGLHWPDMEETFTEAIGAPPARPANCP